MSGAFAVLVSVIAAFVAVIAFLVANSQTPSANQKTLQILTICTLVLAVGNAFCVVATDAGEYYLAEVFMHYGTVNILLCLTLYLCNICDIWLKKPFILGMFCYNLVIVGLFSTNPIHGMMYSSVEGEFDGMTFLPKVTFGPLYPAYVFMLIMYLGILIWIAAFVMLKKRYLLRNKNIQINLIGFAIAAVASVANMVMDLLNDFSYNSSCILAVLTTVILLAISYLFPVYNMRSNTQEDILDELNDIILVYDSFGGFVYANKGCREAFPNMKNIHQMMPVHGLCAELDGMLNEENGNMVTIGENIFSCFQSDNVYSKRYKTHTCWLKNITKEQKYITELEYLRNNLSLEVEKQMGEVKKRQSQLEQLSLQSVHTLADAIDAKDPFTKGHSKRVAHYSVLLAAACGMADEELEALRYDALLHDVGRIGVPDTILTKPGKLTELEYQIVKSHTVMGADILSNSAAIVGADDVARYHHERYDGTGYPDQLEGENIPFAARIVAIADAYDAMNSRRIYRNALDLKKIREELVNGRGKQFDPVLLDKFLKLMDEGVLEYEGEARESDSEQSGEYGNVAAESGVLLHRIIEQMTNKDGEEERDSVTGLLTRASGERKISVAMGEVSGALAFFDVDNLKRINDTFGHDAGDRSLNYLGEILSSEEDTVCCRLGGDEFLAFFKECDKKAVDGKMTNIINSYLQKKDSDLTTRAASISGGVIMTDPAMPYEQAFNHADKALYHVKQNGKAGYYFYQGEDSVTEEIGEIDLQLLRKSLSGSGNYDGAMGVEFRVFARMYEYVKKLSIRYQSEYQLIMISLNSEAENVSTEENERAMTAMETSINECIRNVDIYTRYGANRFLVIIVQADANDIVKLTDRVFTQYKKVYGAGAFVPGYEVSKEEILKETVRG